MKTAGRSPRDRRNKAARAPPAEIPFEPEGDLAGRITGDGTVYIAKSSDTEPTTTTFHWIGGSGTSLATAANWQENKAPAFEGADILVFDKTDADAAVVEGTREVYGIVFRAAASFTLGADDGACLKLGKGAFAVTNSTGAGTVTFTVQAPVELQSNSSEWSIGTNAVLSLPATLSAAEGINAPAIVVPVNGTGSLDLGGDNAAFRPTWRFTNVSFVPVIRHSAALGSPDRAIEVRSVPKGQVALTNAVPLNIYNSYWNPATRHVLNPSPSKYFDQRGKITFMTKNCTGYISLYGGSISGGVGAGPDNTNAGLWLQSLTADIPVRIESEPIAMAGVVTLDNLGEFRLASVGNKWSGLKLNKSLLVCENDQVLDPTGDLVFSMPNQGAIYHAGYGDAYGILNLNGHPQTVRMMKSCWNVEYDTTPSCATRHAFVDSSAAAALTLTGVFTNDDVRCCFVGRAGLTFAASGTMRFTKWVSTSAGRLTVQSGAFVFDANGGWGGTNAEVAVTGGQLSVAAGAAGTAFGGAHSLVNLSLSGTGKIDLADDCTVTVNRLVVDGREVAAGYYGGSNAPASAVRDYAAHFGFGTGVLRVLRPSGMLLLLR